ncbi:MAG: DUF4974 domain-containing protein [Prevotella sp.]|nr:DUF4974 domain-containing protein [Prevotella sp.]
MDCKDFRNIVADLFDKEVDPQTKQLCEEHAAGCNECKAYLEELKQTAELLRPKHSPVSMKPNEDARTHEPKAKTRQMHRAWSRQAAMFVGILLTAGVAFAAIHVVRQMNQTKQPTTVSKTAESAFEKTAPMAPADTLSNDSTDMSQPVVFENAPLEQILNAMATHYGASVEFRNADARQLRFHFVWTTAEPLQRQIERLNLFESLHISTKGETIIVE